MAAERFELIPGQYWRGVYRTFEDYIYLFHVVCCRIDDAYFDLRDPVQYEVAYIALGVDRGETGTFTIGAAALQEIYYLEPAEEYEWLLASLS